MTESDTPANGLPVEWDKLPLLLRPEDLAALFQVTKKTISTWHTAGEIPRPVIKSGNVVRWQRDTIRKWIESCQQ